MLPLLITCCWLAVLMAVVALCRSGSRADRASAADLPHATRPLRLHGLPGLRVWEQGDRARLERGGFAARRLHMRARRGAHRPQRRPAACA